MKLKRIFKEVKQMERTIVISEETYEKIKEQLTEAEQVDVSELADFVGRKLFIRTVTYHLIGKVTKLVSGFFELEGAVWVADSGRFMDALKNGTLSETEPTTVRTWVSVSSIVDMFEWKHKLPTEQR
jgi:predicted nuclease with TOPRIM domain